MHSLWMQRLFWVKETDHLLNSERYHPIQWTVNAITATFCAIGYFCIAIKMANSPGSYTQRL